MKTKVINIDTCINSLIKAGQKFQINETSLSCELICKYGTFNWTQNSNLKLHELGFIRQVWNYANKLPIPKKIDRQKIRYIDINRNFHSVKNCYEIDLNSAYWEIAYKNGYLSDEIYNKGKKKEISKFARLVALGNLAKVKYHLYYNGKEYEFQGTTESELKDIFFNSCLQTSKIMQDLKFLVNENYLFYWVDAIFVNSEKAMQTICNYLNLKNIAYKVKFIPEIENNEQFLKCFQQDETKKPKIYWKVKNDIRTPINKLLNLAKVKKDIEEHERRISNFSNDEIKKLCNGSEFSDEIF